VPIGWAKASLVQYVCNFGVNMVIEQLVDQFDYLWPRLNLLPG